MFGDHGYLASLCSLEQFRQMGAGFLSAVSSLLRHRGSVRSVRLARKRPHPYASFQQKVRARSSAGARRRRDGGGAAEAAQADPDVVASAIVHAADHPVRDLAVGGGGEHGQRGPSRRKRPIGPEPRARSERRLGRGDKARAEARPHRWAAPPVPASDAVPRLCCLRESGLSPPNGRTERHGLLGRPNDVSSHAKHLIGLASPRPR